MSNQKSHEFASSLEGLPAGYTLSTFQQLTLDEQTAYEQKMRLLLEPLYGSQDTALEKIRRAEDRQAEILLDENGQICATLVYKNDLVSETHWDMRNGDTVKAEEAFEVKTLALFHPENDGAKGLGLWLATRAENLARAANAKGIVLTVADGSKAKDFFTHAGQYNWALYQTNRTPETSGDLLYKPLQVGGIDKSGRWFS